MSQRRALKADPIETLLGRLSRFTLVAGKGGVGKTTASVGIAARFAAAGEKTLIVSTDPAGALGTALGVALKEGRTYHLRELPALSARQLDARSARRTFLRRWRDTIVTIIDRGTYLDVGDIEGLVDAAFPGADEVFALLALGELLERNVAGGADRWRRIVVDTAPTGHTLRLLELPATFDAMIALLETMQSKHRFMVSALTHRYRRDRADEFLDAMRAAMEALRRTLGDRERSGVLLVARPEPVVVAETLRYAAALRSMGLAIAALLVNAVPDRQDETTRSALASLSGLAGPSLTVALPQLDPPPEGVAGIAEALGKLRILARGKGSRGARKGLRGGDGAKLPLVRGGPPGAARAHSALTLLRTLTVTGGKGGVGKTTVSCALALAAADSDAGLEGGRVLLVSTDPAPSIADALGVDADRWARTGPEPVRDVARLDAWQMDAAAAFGQLRDRYQDRIDALFDALVGRGVDASYDRAVLRQLLALAPPGIDELYALASLGETLAERRFERIIVDPAPTGHLLRLIEMPALALDWSHRLMRLMLKYKEVGGLGDAAGDLVAFSRRTRALDALLHDAARAGVVLVTIDEPLVRAESERLRAALERARIAVVGTVRNRVTALEATNPVHRDAAALEVAAPISTIPLVGQRALREWYDRWRVAGQPRMS